MAFRRRQTKRSPDDRALPFHPPCDTDHQGVFPMKQHFRIFSPVNAALWGFVAGGNTTHPSLFWCAISISLIAVINCWINWGASTAKSLAQARPDGESGLTNDAYCPGFGTGQNDAPCVLCGRWEDAR